MKRIDDVWASCPEGEIRRFVAVMRMSRQRRIMANLLTAAATILLVATGWTLIRFFG